MAITTPTWDVNEKPANHRACVYQLITTLVAAGWVIKSSGDGLSAFSSSTTVFTNGAASGANGWNNGSGTTYSWARLADPGATGRELLFATNSATAGQITVLESINGTGFTGGSPSATVAPTAADSVALIGAAGANGGATWTNGTSGSVICHAYADASAPYTFAMWTVDIASPLSLDGFIGCDVISSPTATEPSLDAYYYRATGGSWGASNGFVGRTNGQFGTIATPGLNSSSSPSQGNPYNSQNHDLVQFPLDTSLSVSANYFRGWSTNWLWDYHYPTKSANTFLPGATLAVATGGFVVGSTGYTVPWSGATPRTS
jgi:hypothetical protein